MRWAAGPFALVLAVVGALGPAAAAAGAQVGTPVAAGLPAGVEVVANGLDNPRNFTWDEAGRPVVAIAGVGGDVPGLIDGAASGLEGGPTASVVALDGGCPTMLAGGLPSSVWVEIGWVWGTADVAYLDGELYQLASGGGSDYGNFETPAGVYRVEADGSSTLVADYSAWSRANMPAFVPPDFNADGTLNDLFAADGRLWAVDAILGRIVTVTPDGTIALFKDYSEGHLVPTGIVPDGAGGLYVSNLTTIPYPTGAAEVVRIGADGAVEKVWTGLTAVTGLAMGPDGALYASELTAASVGESPYLPPNSGRIVRQTGPGGLEPVVTDLPYPASLGFGPDGGLYVTTPAFGAGNGAGQGAMLRVEASVGAPVSLAGVDLSAPICGGAATPAGGAPGAAADAADAATPVATTPLLRLSLAGQTMDAGASVGVTRLTFDPGGGQRASAGSGVGVLFVEAGALSLTSDAGAPPPLVARGGGEPVAAPEALAAGTETTLAAGDALLLPAGGAAEFRNAGGEPALALRLLGAADARVETASGVTESVLVRGVEAIGAPGALRLERLTLPAGARLALPEPPVQAVLAGLDPGRALLLSTNTAGGATNRSLEPLEVYLLTLEPVA